MAHHNGGSAGGGGHPSGFTYLNSLTPPGLRLPAGVDSRITYVPVPPDRHYQYKDYNSGLSLSRYPTAGSIPSQATFSSHPSADVQQQQQQPVRDYHRSPQLDIREKRSNDTKKSTDQAVQQHFDESLRLASQKLWQQQQQQPKYEEEPLSRLTLPPAGPVSSSAGLEKPFYGAPSSFDPAKGPIEAKILYPKGGPVLQRTREPPPFSVHRREADRSHIPPPSSNHVKSNLIGYYQPAVNRAKVSSPAPPQFYGKPDARVGSSVPSTRHYDISEVAPLSLTSKTTTVARNSPPVTSGSSLPQHEVRSAELANFYMHSSGPSGYGNGSSGSPSPQVQPLDLGGKRKSEHETNLPPNLEPKKVKSDDLPLDLKATPKVPSTPPTHPAVEVKPWEKQGFPLNPSRITDGLPAEGHNLSGPDSKPTNLSLSSINSSQIRPYDLTRDSSSPMEVDAKVSSVPPSTTIPRGRTPPPAISRSTGTPPSTTSSRTESVSPSVETANSQDSSSTSVVSTGGAPKKAWLEKYSGQDGDTSKNQNWSTKTSVGGYLKGGNENNSVTPSKNGQLSFNSTVKNNGSTSRKSGGVKSQRKAEGVDGNNAVANRKQRGSSDSEEGSDKPVARRALPKGKRKNGRRSKKKSNTVVEPPSESDKGGSDSGENSSKGKDSPSNPPTPPDGSSDDRRPGGRPKGRAASPKNDRKNQYKRPSVKELKKSGEHFLQDRSCPDAKELHKCRECRTTTGPRGKSHNPFCRFYAFRKLYYKKGALDVAGFSDPMEDATTKDKNLWLPTDENLPQRLEFSMSKTLIEHLGDQFCSLVREENEAAQLSNRKGSHEGKGSWKRVISGVRDMCDVCETTLFNYHWACEKCGFVVCIACFKSRKNGRKRPETSAEKSKGRDAYQWLYCLTPKGKNTVETEHDVDNLMLTQVIAGDALNELGRLVHEMRKKYDIPQNCGCSLTQKEENQEDNSTSEANGVTKSQQNDGSSSSDDSEDEDGGGLGSLRNILNVPQSKQDNSCPVKEENEASDHDGKEANTKPQDKQNPSANKQSENTPAKIELKYFERTETSSYIKNLLPIRSFTLAESTRQYPDLPHEWLCGGNLLKLKDPGHPANAGLFQDMWKRGQPVLVANVAQRLKKDLWTPQAFAKDSRLQTLKTDLVNCMSGKVLSNQPIKKFWEGFDQVEKRLKDEMGNPMLLKLKDWPPGEDFAVLLPDRFEDLMQALPLTDYTYRDGRLNLAARLPEDFVRPDLGPKMYIAYGSGEYLEKGTTNLHLDISDAVNVMVHVGVPEDVDNSRHIEAVRKAISESDCDQITINKVLDNVKTAGALWHIYNSRDADKIRDLLNKVAMERKEVLEPNQDPIHDQSWYLDQDLRKRLAYEYDVIGYPIIQCLGDAVFIPAGAPHQVRNLNNCIKIAEDFVSPENVSHCFDLTEEFRRLSDTHQNHEDKLQIKNIMYHAVKDAISVLMYSSLEKAPVKAKGST